MKLKIKSSSYFSLQIHMSLNQDGRLSYEEMVPAAEEWSKLQLAKVNCLAIEV